MTRRRSGHNYYSTYLRDGGVLLDVSQLRGFDAVDGRVSVGPGLRSEELIAELEPLGYAFPVAHVGSVGLGGLLLGGAMGWNGESWGRFASFNVEGLDVVSADAKALHLSPRSHPELFWAGRGAGPSFCAVATRIQLRVFAKPQVILANLYAFEIASAPAVTTPLMKLASAGLRNVELTLVFETDTEPGARAGRHQACVSATAFGASAAQAQTDLALVAAAMPTADATFRDETRALTFADLFAASNTGAPRR